jgi:hypothetical protein
MSPDDYLECVDTRTNGTLDISLQLLSSRLTSSASLHRLLHSRDLSAGLLDLERGVYLVFMQRIFVSLTEVMATRAALMEDALELFMQLITNIDTSRSGLVRHFFESFVASAFTAANAHLGRLHAFLLGYLVHTLPSNVLALSESAASLCKDCCRTLSYTLRLTAASLALHQGVDEAYFSRCVHQIFRSLGLLMTSQVPALLVAKSFAVRSFPMFCDLLGAAIGREEAAALVTTFLAAVREDPANRTQPLATAQNRARLYRRLTDTEFFASPDVRALLLPVLLADVAAICSGENFAVDGLPTIVNTFLVIARTSRNLVQEIVVLRGFFPMILEACARHESRVAAELITILYYFAGGMECSEQLIAAIASLLREGHPHFVMVAPPTFIRVVRSAQDFRLAPAVAGFYNDFSRVFGALPQPDAALLKRVYGINMQPMADLLPSLLEAAPPSQRFNTGVLCPLFQLHAIGAPETRDRIVDALFAVLSADLEQKGDLERSERAILAMDAFASAGAVEAAYLATVLELAGRVRRRFGEMQAPVAAFFADIEKLAGFLLTVAGLSAEDDRVAAVVELLDDSGGAIFPYLAAHLVRVHTSVGNKTEAAETVLIAANSVEEKMRAVDLFVETDFYERALEVLDGMRAAAKGDCFLLRRVAEREAQCLEWICTKERAVLNRFYGVRFYGSEEKAYVYRRNGFFMAAQMAQDLKDRFPQARVEFVPPGDDTPKDNYIYLFNLKPAEEKRSFDPFERTSAVQYRAVCAVNKFVSEAPVRVRITDGKFNEMAEWHRHVVTYTTEHKLQGVARRSKVISQSEVRVMTPVECAVVDVSEKTIELMQASCEIWRALRFGGEIKQSSVSSMARLIQGIVNAAVNGGTQVFQDLFLEGPLKEKPEIKKFAGDLMNAFRDQLKAVRFALRIHDAVMTGQDWLLHESWVKSFEEAQTSMGKVLGTVDLDEPPSFGEIPSTDFLTVQETEEL